MRTIASLYRSAPAFTRAAFQCDHLFSSSTPSNSCFFKTSQQIRLSRRSLCFSTLPLSASSSPPLTFSEADDNKKIDLSIVHDDGFGHLLNAHKVELGSFDLDKSGDEDEHEHGYADVGISHVPVLLSDVLRAFQDVQLHTFVDCTLGAAGHASSIITTHPELEYFVGLDVDPVAHSEASTRLQEAMDHRTEACTNMKIQVLKANFKNVKNALRQLGLECGEVDGVLMDLGMSSMQLNVAERGFSLQLDGPLDMRMDPMASTTASDILNSWPESEIGRIIREYGEERQWRRLAKKISEAQHLGGIHSTAGLLQLIQKALPSRFSPGRVGWKKTAVRVFQALRIAVNDELLALKVALPDAFGFLRPGGRLVVISFHSLEDRIVKQFFLKAMGETVVSKANKSRVAKYNPSMLSSTESTQWEGAELGRRGMKVLEGTHALILTKRPLIAGSDEVKSNPRARSAKLRILVKK